MDVETILLVLFQNPTEVVEHVEVTDAMIAAVAFPLNLWQPEIHSNFNFSVLYPLGQHITDFFFYTSTEKSPFYRMDQLRALEQLFLGMVNQKQDQATRDSILFGHRGMYSSPPVGPAEFDMVRPSIVRALKHKLNESQ